MNFNQGHAANLSPHEASYSIKSVSIAHDSQLLQVHGRMTYRLSQVCDAWLLERNTGMQISLNMDTPITREIESVYNAYESHDGKTYEYFFSQKLNGEVIEMRDGRVERANLEARSTSNVEGNTLDGSIDAAKLPSGTLFPVATVKALLDGIEKGVLTSHIDYFDGIEYDGLWQVNTQVQPLRPSRLKARFPNSPLVSDAVWHVTSGYFRPGAESPDFEVSYRLHPSSLTENVMLVLSDMTLEMTLETFKTIPDGC